MVVVIPVVIPIFNNFIMIRNDQILFNYNSILIIMKDYVILTRVIVTRAVTLSYRATQI